MAEGDECSPLANAGRSCPPTARDERPLPHRTRCRLGPNCGVLARFAASLRALNYKIAGFCDSSYSLRAMADRKKAQDSNTDEKRVLWLLRKVPLFDGMSPERLQQLAGDVELREIPRRQVIYLPGDPGESIFIINGGRVKCSKVTRDGKELTLAYRGAGELFGELAVLDANPREEMAEAMKNAMITEIPREVFEALLLEDPALCFRFTRTVGRRRRQLETKIEHLVFRDVQAKLAALLLELGEEYGQEVEDGLQIGVKITHQEMANLIGSTRETISLTLAQFKKRGLLDMRGRSVVLLDSEGMRAAT